ncbi:dethiobiotin synthase [Glaciecola sp. MH2013]|nr:dethiobiotin synthase [Glaciecola sp. MH2013]
MKTVFITGTDTDAGKTYVSVLILQMLNAQGISTAGFKPISAGCHKNSGELRNDDALALQAAASVKLEYETINPIAFEPPIAPHIAAKEVGYDLSVAKLDAHYASVREGSYQFSLIEGAGGWRLPLNFADEKGNAAYLSDFVVSHSLPTILVVGMKLGCLNHALLTYEQMKRDGANIVGWIANRIDEDMIYYDDNLLSLRAAIRAPLLAELAYNAQEFTRPHQRLLDLAVR